MLTALGKSSLIEPAGGKGTAVPRLNAGAHSLDRSVQPRSVDNLERWLFFQRAQDKEAVWIIGNAEVDHYLAVRESKMDVVSSVIEYFDGTHSVQWIEDFFLRKGKQIDVMGLYRRMSNAGLIASPRRAAFLGDIERNSVKLFQVDVQWWFRLLARLVPAFFPLGLWLTFACILSGAWCMVKDPYLLYYTVTASVFQSSTDAWLYVSLIFVSFLFHEMAHGFVASRYQLYARKLEGALYMGILPMVYLRIGGLYTLPANQRIKVWGAGIYWNFTFTSACILYLNTPSGSPTLRHIIALVAVSNLTLALSNLFPFLPTDGYFLLTTLLKRHNIRRGAWGEVRKMIFSRGKDFSVFAVLYALISTAILGRWIFGNVVWIVSNHPLQSKNGTLRALLFVVPLSVILFRYCRSKLQSQSSFHSLWRKKTHENKTFPGSGLV